MQVPLAGTEQVEGEGESVEGGGGQGCVAGLAALGQRVRLVLFLSWGDVRRAVGLDRDGDRSDDALRCRRDITTFSALEGS